MTIRELKELLNQFDENLLVTVKDDFGDYDLAADVYEDVESYCSATDFAAHRRSQKDIDWQTRRVIRIH